MSCSTTSPQQFSGKRVLVTGAGQGLGREFCLHLAREGAHVVAVSRTQKHLDSLKQEIEEKGGSCSTISVDLSDGVATKQALEDSAGEIDLLVNNAGTNKLHSFLDTPLQDWDVVVNTNLKSAFVFVAKQLVAAGKPGAIVNVSSQASLIGIKDHTAYCASKGGMDQLTRVMALELGPHNIRVNSVNPTVVLTELGKATWGDPAIGDPMKAKIPLGRFAEPSEVSEAVIFLLSNKASMINGVILPVDGGCVATR